jgi:nicotinamidase-related amidase
LGPADRPQFFFECLAIIDADLQLVTSIGVEPTARQAYELGFNVTLATDAMTDRSAEAHASSLTRIFPRLGERGTAQEIIEFIGRTRV